MRAQGLTQADIAERLGVHRCTVSKWVRDVDFDFVPSSGRYGPHKRPHPWHGDRLTQIEEWNRKGIERIGSLGVGAFFAAGVALYAGEGAKTDGAVKFANSDPEMVRFFCAWLRRFFEIDESRLRVRVYLHQGLDLDAAEAFWSKLTDISRTQFGKAYRAVPDPSIRKNKHKFGCVYVSTRARRRTDGSWGAAIVAVVFRGGAIGSAAVR